MQFLFKVRTSRWILFLWGIAVLLTARAGAAGFTQYVYVSDKRVITVELIDQGKVILNYINLDDTVELVRASDLVIVDLQDRPYPGHLFLNEEPDSKEPGRFRVSALIGPREFKGFDVLSRFRFEAPPTRAYLGLGGRIIALQSMTPEEFEMFASKVGNINLEEPNSKLAVMDAGFWQGLGELIPAGSSKSEELSRFFTVTEPLPPRVIDDPAPRLGPQFGDLVEPVLVLLRVTVTAEGGVTQVEVVEAPQPELGEIAEQVVSNSWTFLPAVAEGKPAAAELVLRVVFQRYNPPSP